MVTYTVSTVSKILSLEDWMLNPPDGTEWVDGQLVEKNGMTSKHSRTQSRLDYYWRSYMISGGQGGEVYVEASCRTAKQGRRADVAYISAKLLEQFGEEATFPQSFPLIAEVASPDDSAEELFAKAREYLQSSCQEVWLLFPENQVVIIITQQKWLVFTAGEVVSTQTVLQGFSVAVNELLA